MRVALHDADATNAPNLALMKLSAWHKSQGHDVDWFSAIFPAEVTYSSKVFSWTGDDAYLPADTILGGSGHSLTRCLPDHVEHICPDYALYNVDRSYGFLTRGCPRRCSWCIVPQKEGPVRAHADIEEFTRHRDVVLMDNNVLAHDHGIKQIEKISRLDLRVDFNQGLDARLIDSITARLLASVKWMQFIRLACDHASQQPVVGNAVRCLRDAGVNNPIRVYVLLTDDIEDAHERCEFLRGLPGEVLPFVQPYRDQANTPPSREQRRFARWASRPALFRTVRWEDYK